jgi:hypothetical protein
VVEGWHSVQLLGTTRSTGLRCAVLKGMEGNDGEGDEWHLRHDCSGTGSGGGGVGV